MSVIVTDYRAPARRRFGNHRFLEKFNLNAQLPLFTCCGGIHVNTRSNCGAAELGSVAQVYTKAFGGDAMREEVQIPSSGDSVVPLEPEPEPLNSLDEGNSLMEYQSEKSEREMDCPKVVIAENEELTDEELMRCIVDGKPMRKTQEIKKAKVFSMDDYFAANSMGKSTRRRGDVTTSEGENVPAKKLLKVDMTNEAIIVLESMKGMGKCSVTYLANVYCGKWKNQTVTQAQKLGHLSLPMCGRGNMLTHEDAITFFQTLATHGLLSVERVTGRYKNICQYMQLTEKGRCFADGVNRFCIHVEMAGKKQPTRRTK